MNGELGSTNILLGFPFSSGGSSFLYLLELPLAVGDTREFAIVADVHGSTVCAQSRHSPQARWLSLKVS